jgi:hypothetical protein
MFVRRPEHRESGRVVMHGFIKRFADGAFYPEEVQILVAAFDDAWSGLQSSHAPFAEEAYASAAQEILAKHIIMAVLPRVDTIECRCWLRTLSIVKSA